MCISMFTEGFSPSQGGLFAADSPYYLWLVPTLAHSIIVNIINQVYSKVAEKCTDLENHR